MYIVSKNLQFSSLDLYSCTNWLHCMERMASCESFPDICWHWRPVILIVFANYRSKHGSISHLSSGSGMRHIPAEQIQTRSFPHSHSTTWQLDTETKTHSGLITSPSLIFNVDIICLWRLLIQLVAPCWDGDIINLHSWFSPFADSDLSKSLY